MSWVGNGSQPRSRKALEEWSRRLSTLRQASARCRPESRLLDPVPTEPCRLPQHEAEAGADGSRGSHGQLSLYVDALDLLLERGYYVSASLVCAVLKGCIAAKDLVLGRRLHAHTLAVGYECDTDLASNFIRLYGCLGRVQEAAQVFTKVPVPSASVWCSMIVAHAEGGQAKHAIALYRQMVESNVRPRMSTFLSVLKACSRTADLASGKQVHADVLRTGVEPSVLLGNCLIDMYVKCGSLEDARTVFDALAERDVITWTALVAGYAKCGDLYHARDLFERMPTKNVVTWNAMITGYARHGLGQEALDLYAMMQSEGITLADHFTFACLLKACTSIGALDQGKQLHSQIQLRGLEAEMVIGNCLVDMYAKCGSLEDARRLFDGLPTRDKVTWTVMIAGYVEHGLSQEALSLYERMQKESITPADHVTYACLLKACASVGALHEGKELHSQMQRRGLAINVLVGNSLVDMYAKCGSVGDARKVFDAMAEKDVVTWTAMIGGYAQHGLGRESIILYEHMQEEGITPANQVTFLCLLKACASMGALHYGRQLHHQLQESGLEADVVISNCLVDMYAKCGSLEDARRVFDTLCIKDVVTWNAMITGYSQQGLGQEALALYTEMQEQGVMPADVVTFACLLKACASVEALNAGKELHSQIQSKGLVHDVVICNCLVDMYAKCGSLLDARSIFDRIPARDVVSWNAMLSGYVQHGLGRESLSLYAVMKEEGMVSGNVVTFVCLLKACGAIGALLEGKELHLQIQEAGLSDDVILGNSLIDMYSKCASLEDARRVFDNLPMKDVVTWNAILTGYAQHELGQEALSLYSQMRKEGITSADPVTFASLLKACAGVGALHAGKELHLHIQGLGLEADALIGDGLVDMYAKCGSMEDAQRVFDTLPNRHVRSWNMMLSGYARQGLGQECLALYKNMQLQGITPADQVTFVNVLKACASIGALHEGKELHSQIQEKGLDADVVISNSLVDMYAKCGSLEDARTVFDKLPTKDVVTWNVMLAGYSQHGLGEECLALYAIMEHENNAPPDPVTYTCVLKACASIGALVQGKEIHRQIQGRGMEVDVFIGNCLVDMYAKCGSFEDACSVFERLSARDVVSWNAMIAGCAQHGCAEEALHYYDKMRLAGVKPNEVTFLSLLSACSHAGFLDNAVEFLESMSRDHDIAPNIEHYVTVIDLFGRAGRFTMVERFLSRMPMQPVLAMWLSLLGACRKYGNVPLGERAFYNALQLDPKHPAAYVLMSQIYADAGFVNRAVELQALRQNKGAWKNPGQTWIEHDQEVHRFVIGGEHPQHIELCNVLETVELKLKQAG